MSTSPLGPEDIRAAAEVHRELGPEYDDAVVAAFIDRVDREVAARVQARLAETAAGQVGRRASRRSLVKGMAIGLCAGGLLGVFGIIHVQTSGPVRHEFSITRVPGVPPPHKFTIKGNFGGGATKTIVVVPKSAPS
jgi:hypothetical protein